MSSQVSLGGGLDMNKATPHPAQTSVRLKSKEEKYAEDVLKLHEAYQVILLHVFFNNKNIFKICFDD